MVRNHYWRSSKHDERSKDGKNRSAQRAEGSLKPLIVSRIGTQRAQHFIDNWRQLVLVLKRGELRPGHLKAAKPE